MTEPQNRRESTAVGDERHESAVRDLSRRVGTALAARAAVWSLAGYAAALGVAVLVLRGPLAVESSTLAWGLLGFLPVALLAVLWGMRSAPGTDELRRLVDGASRAGGLIMSASERSLGDWRPAESATPVVRWRYGRPVAVLAVMLAFLLASYFVPGPRALAGSARLEIDRDVKDLIDRVELLEKEEILSEREAEEWRERIEEVERNAEAVDPNKTWESLDRLAEDSERMGEEAAEKETAAKERLANAESLAGAVSEAMDKLTSEQLAEAMEALGQELEAAMEEKDKLGEAIDQELLEKLEKGELTAEELKELEEKLSQACEQCDGKVGRLVAAKLCNGKKLGKCEGFKANKDADLLTLLGECEGDCKAACKSCMNPQFYRKTKNWSVTRGPGHVVLNLDHATEEKGMAFKDEALQGDNVDPNESQLVGILKGTPTAKDESAVQTGALKGVEASNRGAVTRKILPRHRSAVNDYFDRSTTPAPEGGEAGE